LPFAAFLAGFAIFSHSPDCTCAEIQHTDYSGSTAFCQWLTTNCIYMVIFTYFG
jgi:hypothetical protein